MGNVTSRVESARDRRRALREVMSELEATTSTPAGVPGWLKRVSESLDDLSNALGRHVEMVEADDGLLAEIKDMAPNLQPAIDQMRADHKDLQGRVDSTKLAIKEASSGPDGPAEVRRQIRELLSSLADHRERGADLVYDAYNVDITAMD